MLRRMAWLLLLVLATPAAAQERKLNVLFLLSDDMRPDLGCYGHEIVKSPNIDALAKSGVRFERAYCQYPVCNPSRTSMLNGKHPTTTNVLDNRTWFGALHPEFVTLPKHFKANGYVTLRTGKIFHGGIDDADAWTEGGEKRNFEGATDPRVQPPNRKQNSDRWLELDGDGESHNDYKTAATAIEYLRANKDRPFFLACGFTKPHSPPTAPKKFFDMYDPAKIPLPVDFAATPAAPAGFPRQSITQNGDLFIGREATQDEAKKMIQAYDASISWTDWNLGRVMAELDKLGLRENTIVLFWGDHGYHLGEKGKWSKHASLYELGTRVPLVISAPGLAGNGKSSPRIVQSVDIYPTLCDLCKLQTPAGLEGTSLRPLLADPAAKWDRVAYSVHGSNTKLAGVAVRNERYRYAEFDGGNNGAMLIDEVADPHELKNLIDDPAHAKVRDELAALAKKHAAGFKPAAK